MSRLTACLVAVLAVAATRGDDPPKPGGRLSVSRVTVREDALLSTFTSERTRKLEVPDHAAGEGKTRVIDFTESYTFTTARELKFLRVTDTDDTVISSARVKERLKGGGYVVWLSAPLDPAWKKMFRSDILFVESGLTAAEAEPKKPDRK